MLTITQIRFKNILSFGNDWTTIHFDNNQSVLIQGRNGSGKSAAILDTLCFGLFGKPFRKINKPSLVNHKNKKDLIVEVWFNINEINHFHIIRGINPSIFEIYMNDTLINQNSAIKDYQIYLETQILKIDFQAFNQIVILGKATYVAFLRLQQSDRRKFIENVLNLSIFSTMNEINKFKYSELKNQLQSVKNEIEILKHKIELVDRHIKDFQHETLLQQQEHENQINKQIDDIRIQIKQLENERGEKENSIREIDKDLDSISDKLDTYHEYQVKLNSKILQIKKKITFFTENEICPTCENSLDVELRHSKLESFNLKEKELLQAQKQLSSKIDSITENILSIRKDIEYNRELQGRIQIINQIIQQKFELISDLESRKVLNNTRSIQKIIDHQDELNSHIQEKNKKDEKRIEIGNYLDCHEFISMMLKDTGIKSTIVKNFIPKITRIMNDYLNQLGIFIKFELNENFEESLFARGIDPLSYQSFSEGEKLRIDLAMLMTWREICKLQNNMNVNFLIFDEIFDSSLDQLGIENLILIFENLKYSGSKILMISHSDHWSEKFDENWIIEKKLGFSSIMKS